MSERMAEALANTYPGYIGTDPAMACAVRFKWGSLQITQGAIDAYGLSINTDVLEAANQRSFTEPQLRFSADFIIAGPQEIRHNDSSNTLIYGYRTHKSGVAATLGTNIDKDLAGVDMASRLIGDMASELPEDERPGFLMERGVQIQDEIKDQLPVLFSHGFAHVSSKVIQDTFESWANKQAARTATGAVNRASALAIIGTSILNGYDWLDDGNIEGTTALFSLGYIGFLALKARSEIKQAVLIAPALNATSNSLAKSVSQEAAANVHDLLCQNVR